MSYTVVAVIFNLYLLLLKGQTVNLTQDVETQLINATVGEQVLFSTNCSPCINRSVEWKYLSDAVRCSDPKEHSDHTVRSIVMVSDDIDKARVFDIYKDRVNFYTNSSLQLLHIQLNDSGCYTLTITDPQGKIVTLRKVLSVFEAETSKPHIDGKNDTLTIKIDENDRWKSIGIIIGAIVLVAACALFIVAIGHFIKKRRKGGRLADEKINEDLNNDNPMVVYSTFVGGFHEFGRSLQNASLNQT
ncbi:uncharacterized protein LOC103185167 [Callorhinchus milii]|uniref:Uncharacterized LOC103185167 n=1 Tax=Callorhinchus milii TaxID=7868 RepID=A0A4W3JR15_CALMI|nr:uncharacterized protein LOC103185167 [Callorhinchus milii]|eukprot:gi/632970592/ref/XP_007901738.1/ PREDICTED: uncharacterized protein LOC103185167 [Callorhinchus milii]